MSDLVTTVTLRPMLESDLGQFFLDQQDEEARYRAAFTPEDPFDREAYMSKWKKLLHDETVLNKTILVENKIAGSIAKYVMFGEAQITYWISKPYWNRGIASAALKEFLSQYKQRPIFGRTAFDNIASQRVLEKNDFLLVERDRYFSNARKQEIEELIFRLD